MNKIILCAVVSLMLAACGSGSSSSSNEDIGNIESLSELAGLYAWDDSEDGDEGYVHIASNGRLINYDYAGDSYDNYANCYWVDDYNEYITHVSGNTFSVTFEDWSEQENDFVTITEIITITETTNGIRVRGTDIDGDKYNNLLGRSNLNISDLTPDCDDF